MITGHFARNRPIMSMQIILPRLGINRRVNALVDTGAQVTCILPATAHDLGIRAEDLQQPTTLRGVGGTATMYQEPAILAFYDEATRDIHEYPADIRIAPGDDRPTSPPSLIGQDILQHWSLRHEPSSGLLHATPLN